MAQGTMTDPRICTGFTTQPHFELLSGTKKAGSQKQWNVEVIGARIRGTLKDIDPLNKVPFKRATSGVQKGPH